jgi:hypothetical protein
MAYLSLRLEQRAAIALRLWAFLGKRRWYGGKIPFTLSIFRPSVPVLYPNEIRRSHVFENTSGLRRLLVSLDMICPPLTAGCVFFPSSLLLLLRFPGETSLGKFVL